jgi:hypothetical protein
MNDSEKGGEVILFPGVEEAQVTQRYSNEYATNMAPYLMQSLTKHGLSPVLHDIVERHIEDLHLLVNDDTQETESTRHLTYSTSSRLTLEQVKINDDPDDKEWRRVLIVNKTDYDRRIRLIEKQFETFPYNRAYFDREGLESVVYDWIIGEEAITIVANSIHMYRTFGKYIPDYNGQNPYSKAELTINADFITGE